MWEQINSNKRKAAFLVVIMAGVLFTLGYILGVLFLNNGIGGLILAFILWAIMTLTSFFGGDKIFLTMSRARKIEKKDHPILFNVVEEMKIASGLHVMPDIYIIDDPTPNAFATGRKYENASIAVTSGLLEKLTRDELQGVIAHEIGHIKNHDVLYMMIVGIMMGTIVLLADLGIRSLIFGGGRRRTSSGRGGQWTAVLYVVAIILIILAPVIAQLIYFAVSRKKEYLADACSAQYTRYPEGLASALEKISGSSRKLRSATRATASMYIVNPLKLGKKGLKNITRTHPPTDSRINVLRAMSGGADFMEYDSAFKKITGKPVGVIPRTSLGEADKINQRTREEKKEDKRSELERLRQTTDMLWRLNQFIFIACACGTDLKIPPAYSGKKLQCPHCLKTHSVESSGSN